MSAGQNHGADDGSREYAVRELGEDAVRALEVEVVKTYADRLSLGTFVAMSIPTASILEGLASEPDSPAPPRRESTGLSVRARGRLDQAVALSKGLITYGEPTTGASAEVAVRIVSRASRQGSEQTSPPAVTLTRHPDGQVPLHLNDVNCLVPCTDAQAANVLGIELEA